MSENLLHYLSRYQPSFWKVEEDVVAWSVIDKTVMLREEFYLFAQRFEMHGFPDVELLFLFLGSLTDESKLVIHYANAALDGEALGVIAEIAGADWQQQYVERAHQWKLRVSSLNKVKNWKVTLCEMLLPARPLENARLSRQLDSDFLDQMWEHGMKSAGGHPLGIKMKARSFAFALKSFFELPVFVTARELESFQKTGVSQLADIEVQEDEKSLLEKLEEGEEDARMVAALTKLFLPSFSVSGRMHRPQDLPLGGFSDLSNRGTLDRLLVSELAHDSLTMAVRVVNGEALYLRRESPNVRQVPKRHLLLDNGIRIWGVGRVMATAVGLALVKAGEGSFPFSVMAPTEDSVEDYDFSDSRGVFDYMSTLTCQSNLTDQVDAFFDNRTDGSDGTELYIVTSERTAADPELRLMLADRSREVPFQVITVSDKGKVFVYVWNKGAMREHKHLEVDLEKVVHKCQPGTKRDDMMPGDIPVALKRREFPMRFAIQRAPEKMSWVDNIGALAISKYSEMYLLEDDRTGALLLGKDVPSGAMIYGGYEPERDLFVAVLASNNMSRLYVTNRAIEGRSYSFDRFELMKDEQVIAACLMEDGHLLITGKAHVCIYSLDGEWIAGRAVGAVWQAMGGYVNSERGWEKVVLANGQLELLSVAEVPASIKDGVRLNLKKCKSYSYTGATLVKRFTKIHITSAGQLILISPKGTTWQVCVLVSGQLVMRQVEYKILYPDQVAQFSTKRTEGSIEYHVAILENGSEAWLDPRGYVHLVPSDHDVGELSFLTRPGQLSAWHSHHGYCGIHYFKNDDECSATQMEQAWEGVLQSMVKI